MNDAAIRYVKLVLAMGEHDTDYVDAYYGPPEWREQVRETRPTLDFIHEAALALRDQLAAIEQPDDPLESLRLEYLRGQTRALIARAEMLAGRRLKFDDESRELYRACAASHSRGDGELRDRRRVSRGRACDDGEGDAVPDRGTRSRARGAVLPRARADRAHRLCGQRSGAALSRRRHRCRSRGRMADDVRADGTGARATARQILRPISRLRHQLQPRQGSRPPLRRAPLRR